MIAANPAVTLVEVALSKHSNPDKGGHSHAELFDVKSLLYTAEGEAEYEQMLVGPGGERAVMRQLSSYYCEVTGECAPSRGTQDFKWQQVLPNPESMPTGWWDNAREGCPVVGSRVGLLRVRRHPGASSYETGHRVEEGG